MKINRIFIVVIVLLFAVLLLVELKLPEKFVWEHTYRHTDPNPFGSQLVDSLLSSSVKQGYEVKYGDFYTACNDSNITGKSIVFVNQSFDEKILELLRAGHNVLWACDELLPDTIEKELVQVSIDIASTYFQNSQGFLTNDSLHLIWAKDRLYPRKIYTLNDIEKYHTTLFTKIYNDDCTVTPLLVDKRKQIFAVSLNYGKGKLVMTTLPELFSNYYLLEPGGAELLMRLVTQLGNAPIVRYDDSNPEIYLDEEVESQSPLRFFLNNKSLRWAIYLTLTTILLSLVFTARRRQRIIPEIKEPENQTLNMVKHLGLMYYQYRDNASLVRNKYNDLTHELQHTLLIDINNEMNDDENLLFLSQRTKIDYEIIKKTLYRAREISNNEDAKLADKDTRQLIDEMNKILRNI